MPPLNDIFLMIRHTGHFPYQFRSHTFALSLVIVTHMAHESMASAPLRDCLFATLTRDNLHWWPNVFSSSAHFKCFRFFFQRPDTIAKSTNLLRPTINNNLRRQKTCFKTCVTNTHRSPAKTRGRLMWQLTSPTLLTNLVVDIIIDASLTAIHYAMGRKVKNFLF